MNMKGHMHSKKDVYHNQGIDINNMGQLHIEMTVYQNQCPIIGDYDIVYRSTQMCAYCDVDWVGNMDDRKSTLGYVFLLEMVVSIWITKKNLLLLCH